MKPITHKQAIQWIHRRLDGLLNEDQLLSLEEHLRSCDTCRAYAINMDGLSAHLQNEFHRHWDTQAGPSQNVFEYVTTRAGAIPMANRISSGVKLLAGAMALIVLGIAINFVVSQLRDTSIAAIATEPVDGSSFADNRLLAFTSDQNGNLDIYIMHADRSELTNLTNNPAPDTNPIWSPDGRYIAFESNRDGFKQIYLMDADGSNVVQLTNDEAYHSLPLNINGKSNPWSPDGSKLLFLQEGPKDETWLLYSMSMNGENKVLLASGKMQFDNVSWSPDGKHIGYVLNESPNPREIFMPGIYVVNSDGSNPRELKKLIPKNEDLYLPYYWSTDGKSIIFIVNKDNGQNQTVYEFNLETNVLTEKETLESGVIDWQDDVSLIMERFFVWQRSDGTRNTLDWGNTSYGIDVTRSTHGNFAMGAYFPDDNEFKLYWANSDGSTIKQLINSPQPAMIGEIGDITWSHDDQYIAFNISLPNKTDMYVLNVSESLSNPSTQPVQVSVSGGELYSIPSWQPISNREVVEVKPTPEPVETLSSRGLIAFVSEESGNADIYIMRADGSEVTNITNSPATDRNPFWSPDGTRITFESDRNGLIQIFVMDANGSHVFQITDGETDHTFENLNPWSPDGSRLLIIEKAPDNDKRLLYSIGTDGQNKTRLTNVPDVYSAPSWSPNGQHVAYIIVEPVGDRDMARIHVVDANGNGNTNITNMLPADEDLYSWNYSWTREGNISFIAARVSWENNNGKFVYYEAAIDGATLAEIAKTSTPLEDYWDGTMFVRGFGDTLTWLRADGTYNEFKPYERCQKGDETQSPGSYSKRSSSGYLLFSAGCPNGDLWLYWSNPKGTTTRPLFESPIPIAEGGLNEIYWSPDGGYAALTISSAGETSLYIVDIREALKAPLALPKSTVLGRNDIAYSIAWQPKP